MSDHIGHQSGTLVSLLANANQLRHQKSYEAAVALYLHVLEQFGETAELFATIAHCYFALDLGNSDRTGENLAVTWMKRAVDLMPDSGRYHADLAQFYALGALDYEIAAQEYRRAIELAPTDVTALTGAASLYGVPENVVSLEEAIGWLKRVTQLEPGDPNYHFRLGQLYFEASRSTKGRSEWLKALLCPKPLSPSRARTIESDLAGSDEVVIQNV